jgi:hypothetical protein
MVATPVLAGALLRIVMGVLVDHLKPKMAGAIGQVIVIAPWPWPGSSASTATQVLVLGLFLGVAGAPSPWRCRWPPAGIRRSTRAPRWASPAPATPAPRWPRCSGPAWPPPSAG